LKAEKSDIEDLHFAELRLLHAIAPGSNFAGSFHFLLVLYLLGGYRKNMMISYHITS